MQLRLSPARPQGRVWRVPVPWQNAGPRRAIHPPGDRHSPATRMEWRQCAKKKKKSALGVGGSRVAARESGDGGLGGRPYRHRSRRIPRARWTWCAPGPAHRCPRPPTGETPIPVGEFDRHGAGRRPNLRAGQLRSGHPGGAAPSGFVGGTRPPGRSAARRPADRLAGLLGPTLHGVSPPGGRGVGETGNRHPGELPSRPSGTAWVTAC